MPLSGMRLLRKPIRTPPVRSAWLVSHGSMKAAFETTLTCLIPAYRCFNRVPMQLQRQIWTASRPARWMKTAVSALERLM